MKQRVTTAPNPLRLLLCTEQRFAGRLQNRLFGLRSAGRVEWVSVQPAQIGRVHRKPHFLHVAVFSAESLARLSAEQIEWLTGSVALIVLAPDTGMARPKTQGAWLGLRDANGATAVQATTILLEQLIGGQPLRQAWLMMQKQTEARVWLMGDDAIWPAVKQPTRYTQAERQATHSQTNPSFTRDDGRTFHINMGTQHINKGTQHINRGTQHINQGTQIGGDVGMFKAGGDVDDVSVGGDVGSIRGRLCPACGASLPKGRAVNVCDLCGELLT